MLYFNYTSPRKVSYYGETETDLALMPTTTKIGEGEYPHALAPEGSYAIILTDDALRLYMLRSTGWVDITQTGGGSGGGGTGTNNYNDLTNKPQINDVTLRGNKTFEELGLKPYTAAQIQVFWDSI